MIRPTHNGISQYIREIDAYIPVKPIEEVERELGIRAIKLANENPLGPSPLGIEAACGRWRGWDFRKRFA